MKRIASVAGSVLFGIGMFVSAMALAADGSAPSSSIGPQSTDNPRVIWKRQLGGPDGEHTYGVATDPNGNILLSGQRLSGSSAGTWIAKLASSGDPLWWRQTVYFGSPRLGSDAYGNVLLAGGSWRLYLEKYSLLGDELWKRDYIIEGSGTVYSIAHAPTSVAFDRNDNAIIGVQFYHGCHIFCQGGGMWARILKINSSGDIVWLSWPLGGDGSNSIAAVATDLNDNVLVSGTTTGESWRYPWIIKFAPSGEVLWWTIPDDAGDRDASGAAVDPAGNIVIVGRRLIKDSHGNWTPAGGWTGKYSPTGDLLWTRGMADQPAGVATDAAGNIVIHGNIAGRVDSDPSDAWVQKRDPDGNVLWKVRLHTRKEDTSAGVTVDFEGNVVVGGTTYGSLGAPNSGEADAWIAKLWP